MKTYDDYLDMNKEQLGLFIKATIARLDKLSHLNDPMAVATASFQLCQATEVYATEAKFTK